MQNAILRSVMAQILARRGHLVETRQKRAWLFHPWSRFAQIVHHTRLWKVFTDLACDATLGPVNIILDGLDEREDKV